MAAKTQIAWNQPTRRRDPRRVSALTVDITVVRANRSDKLPGRCLNVSARGFGAALAGELRPGEVVGIELALPSENQRWRADAVVRHRRRLDHGFEFAEVAEPQRKVLLEWLRSKEAEPGLAELVQENPEASPDRVDEEAESAGWRWVRRACVTLMFLLAFTVGVVWRWQQGWKEIESRTTAAARAPKKVQPEARVPYEEMEKRLVQRAEPDYPEAARTQGIGGVVLLDVVVGRDGSVAAVDVQSGPEVLTRAAAEAVRWWKFEPFQIDGRPAVVGTTVEVDFKP